jgi:SAM-dependent methyltransferase
VSARRWLKTLRQRLYRTSVGQVVRFGSLRRLTPVSRTWGYERGQPIDRYYIENFVGRWAEDVRGRALEIKDDSYIRRFGGDRVTRIDVLDVAESNQAATIIADLTRAEHMSADAFDCIIFTETLQLIYDMRAAINTLHRLLKPGGILLATFPGISQIGYEELGDSWCWMFTRLAIRRLFEEVFTPANVRVEAHGNVLTAIGFLHGLAAEELCQKQLDYQDPNYEVVITLRAVKSYSTVR